MSNYPNRSELARLGLGYQCPRCMGQIPDNAWYCPRCHWPRPRWYNTRRAAWAALWFAVGALAVMCFLAATASPP